MSMGASQNVEDRDVIELLIEQHREAQRLFREVREAGGEARREPFEQVVRLLAAHETAEEEIVYPTIRSSVPDGDRLAEARLAEESEAKEALSELESMEVTDPAFQRKLEACERLVLAHASNEEQEIFPQLRATQSPDELRNLGKAFQAAEAVAPTHPHPHGPESAVGNVLVGPFVAIADRVRDAIRGVTKK